MMLSVRKYLAAVAAVAIAQLAAHACLAQAADDPAAQYPAPVNAFEIEGGQQWQLSQPKKNHSFYRASYLGALIDSRGTPFRSADHIDFDAPPLVEAAGDKNQIVLRIQDGQAEVGGGFFDAAGLMPIPLAGIEKLRLRGAGTIAGDLNGDAYRIALGLETPPLRVPGASGAGISNWLTIGVAAQREEATDTDTLDENSGIATAGLFLGKAFGWRKTSDARATAARLQQLLLEAAPTRTAAIKKAEELKAIAANQRSKFQQLLIDATTESTSEEDWAETLAGLAEGTADAITDEPTLAVYLEASGWYQFTRTEDEDREKKGLVTLNADYWPLQSRKDIFLRLRYEYGYERARPDERLNQLMLSVSVRL